MIRENKRTYFYLRWFSKERNTFKKLALILPLISTLAFTMFFVTMTILFLFKPNCVGSRQIAWVIKRQNIIIVTKTEHLEDYEETLKNNKNCKHFFRRRNCGPWCPDEASEEFQEEAAFVETLEVVLLEVEVRLGAEGIKSGRFLRETLNPNHKDHRYVRTAS